MKKIFVMVFAAMLVFAFTLPARAVDVKMDAVLIFDAGWLSTDENFQRNTLGQAADSDWEGGTININPFGFYGFTLKDKNVGLKVNIAPRGYGDDLNGNDTIYLRQFYGWWQVNPMFNLTVGQLASKHSGIGPSFIYGAVTPMSDAPGWAGPMRAGLYTYLLGFGNHFARRIPQVQLNFAFSPNAALQIAFIDPNNAGGDDETKMPRIDITATLKFGPITIMPSYMTNEKDYSYDTGVTGPGSLDINQWCLPVRVSMGSFTFQGEYHTGVNLGNSNLYPHRTGYNLAGGINTAAILVGDKYYDTDTDSYWGEINFKAGKYKPGFLYGVQKSENTDEAVGAARFEREQSMWGLYLKWSATPHWTITPYYAEFDHGNDTLYGATGAGADGPDMGKVTNYGINFMVAF